jgi:hypothetical protein
MMLLFFPIQNYVRSSKQYGLQLFSLFLHKDINPTDHETRRKNIDS